VQINEEEKGINRSLLGLNIGVKGVCMLLQVRDFNRVSEEESLYQ
jgi:hypothetical protein